MTAQKHIATEALFINGQRAANPGDEIPAEHLDDDKYGWADKVESIDVDDAEAPESFGNDTPKGLSQESLAKVRTGATAPPQATQSTHPTPATPPGNSDDQ